MFLLDTNAVSDLMRDPTGKIGVQIVQTPRSIVTSIIVAGEIRFGLERRPSTRLARQVEQVFGHLSILPFQSDADEVYARIRASLERRGTPISGNDLLIAAHALSLGATLVTDNVREFVRVEGLVIENWLRP